MALTVDPIYLLPHVRLYIGDINPAAYRYTDAWLMVAIQASVKALGAWWRDRYLLDGSNLVYRNTEIYFEDAEPPVIMSADERPIVIMAAVIVLQGSLENSAWDLSSWKDNEISYSNLEGGRIRNSNLQRLWDELLYLLLPPTKKLAGTMKGSLPGYIGNDYERTGDL
jgi:hypothetical protein